MELATTIKSDPSNGPQYQLSLPLTQRDLIVGHKVGQHGEMLTQTTIRKAGDVLFVRKWDSPIRIPRGNKCSKKNNPEITQKRKDNVERSKRFIKEIICANMPKTVQAYNAPCFLTLTYSNKHAPDIFAHNLHLAHVKQFIRKLRNEYGNDLKWIGVKELQDGKRLTDKSKKARNAIHYHFVIFNLPHNDRDLIETFWPYGATNIRRIKHLRKGVLPIANYLAKYLTKSGESLLEKGQNLYFYSRGLVKAESITAPSAAGVEMHVAYNSSYRKIFIGKKHYMAPFDTHTHLEIWIPI